MKTFLKIVGIGCGILLLITLVGSLVLYKACGASLGGIFGGAKKVAEQQKMIEKLDREHPFSAPEDGGAVALTDERLADYLAIRKPAFDILKTRRAELEALGKELEAKKQRGEKPGMGDIQKVATLGMTLLTDCREPYLAGLTERSMSPTEFRAITGTLYGTGTPAGDPAARTELDRQIAEKKVELVDPALDDQRRTLVQAELKSLQAQRDALDGLSGSGDPGVLAANSALIAARRADIDALRDPMLDGFLSGQSKPGEPVSFGAPAPSN